LLLTGCAHRAATRPSAAVQTRPSASSGAPHDQRYAQDEDSGPGGPLPDISKIPEPIPKVEALSAYGNKSTYTVLGQTYRVLPSASGYVERGIASWYGNKFHGYTTSNFEKYDMYAYTAAHKTLPLPSYARVTNLENGTSVIVRVNDRGPFAENRIIDLSYVAAIKLGIWQKGTGLVEVRAIDPAHPDSGRPLLRAAAQPVPAQNAAGPAPRSDARVASAYAPQKAPKPALYLQVGAYSDHANAERAAAMLRNLRLGEVRIVDGVVNGKNVQRVRLGPLKDADEVDSLTPKVRALGLGEPRAAVDD
jgi:rare lipoprotein A